VGIADWFGRPDMKTSEGQQCQLPATLTELQMQIADARPELLTGSESLMACRWHSLAGLPRAPGGWLRGLHTQEVRK
jgi:hypothetical protein